MEKLGGSGPVRPTAGSEGPSGSIPVPASPAPQTASPSAPNSKTASPAPPSSEQNPFQQLTSEPNGAVPKSGIRITPADATTKRSRAPSDQPSNAPPTRKTATSPKEETIEEFESKALGSIFRITLDQNEQFDTRGHKLLILPALRQELEDDWEPIRLTVRTLDSAILEAASKIPQNRPVLDYLLPCWKRVTRTVKGLRGYAGERDAILKEAKRLCMSNIIFAVTMPEIFGLTHLPILLQWTNPKIDVIPIHILIP
jgi:ubiquitin conjugation factor E4 B